MAWSSYKTVETLEADFADLKSHGVGLITMDADDARFRFLPGEVVVGDRGYAHRRGLHSVRRQGGHFVVRLNWQNVPLQDHQGRAVDLLALPRSAPEAGPDTLCPALVDQPAAKIGLLHVGPRNFLLGAGEDVAINNDEVGQLAWFD